MGGRKRDWEETGQGTLPRERYRAATPRRRAALRRSLIAGAAAGALLWAAASPWVVRAATDCPAPGDWRAGGEIYHKTCVTCHGEDGHGARRGVPDFTTGVMAYSSDSLAAHIEHGFRAPGRALAMPPKGGNPGLTTADIRNLLAYLHHAFGCG